MSDVKTILVIDDEPDVLTFLQTVFEDEGYRTAGASNGAEGFRQAKAIKPDLITLDLTMPEQSGVRTYRDLRDDAELGTVPIIIITALGMKYGDFLSSRRQVPAPDGFMTKPMDTAALIKLVTDLIGPAGELKAEA